MSDTTKPAALQVAFVASPEDAQALKAAGFQSVRVVKKASDVLTFTPNYDRSEPGWIIDPTLQVFTRYILAFPRGMESLRDAVAINLDDTRCRWVDWPEDTPSAAAVLRREGPEAVHNAITSARPVWTDEICTLDDIPEPTSEQTFTTGFTLLDEVGQRLIRPALMSVVGPYGSGKSILLRQLAVHCWRAHGWRVLITSFEEKVKPRIQRDLRRHLINKPMAAWRDEEVALADGQIREGFRFLRRKRNAVLDMDRLLGRIEFAVRVYGVDVVILDPFNELDHCVPKSQAKTDYVGECLMSLKQLADDFNLLMIVAAHPPKDGVEKRLSKGKLLTLNDAADSAHFGNKSDIGWCVWRPMLVGPTLLHIDKTKDHETMGVPTLAELDLDLGKNGFRVTRVGYDILASGEE